MKTPDYLSYERYKKRKETNPNKRLCLFVATFFVTLLAFMLVARVLSPDVDVTIGGNEEIEAKDTGLGVKRFIDDRLKQIQMDDSSAGVSTSLKENQKAYNMDDDYSNVKEEKIQLPKERNNKTVEEEPVMPDYAEPQTVAPRPQHYSSQQSSSGTSISKVYIGKYSTLEQARVAQEILLDAGVVGAPFIKNLNGTYTIQAGSYSSRSKAEEVSANLRRNGFPARIEQE